MLQRESILMISLSNLFMISFSMNIFVVIMTRLSHRDKFGVSTPDDAPIQDLPKGKGKAKDQEKEMTRKLRFALIGQRANLIGRISTNILIGRFSRIPEIQASHPDHLRNLARIIDLPRLAIQARRENRRFIFSSKRIINIKIRSI